MGLEPATSGVTGRARPTTNLYATYGKSPNSSVFSSRRDRAGFRPTVFSKACAMRKLLDVPLAFHPVGDGVGIWRRGSLSYVTSTGRQPHACTIRGVPISVSSSAASR